MLTPYRSEPYSDFSDPHKAEAYVAALEQVSAHLGSERAMIVIGDERRDSKASIDSVNPADPNELVAGKGMSQLEKNGVEIIEAYPQKSAATDAENFHGPLQLYLENGFYGFSMLLFSSASTVKIKALHRI